MKELYLENSLGLFIAFKGVLQNKVNVEIRVLNNLVASEVRLLHRNRK